MPHRKSSDYRRIQEQVSEDYDPKTWRHARLWLSRVGFASLVAGGAISTARRLLFDVNASTFRTDPEGKRLLLEARKATSALETHTHRRQWKRFNGELDE